MWMKMLGQDSIFFVHWQASVWLCCARCKGGLLAQSCHASVLSCRLGIDDHPIYRHSWPSVKTSSTKSSKVHQDHWTIPQKPSITGYPHGFGPRPWPPLSPSSSLCWSLPMRPLGVLFCECFPQAGGILTFLLWWFIFDLQPLHLIHES